MHNYDQGHRLYDNLQMSFLFTIPMVFLVKTLYYTRHSSLVCFFPTLLGHAQIRRQKPLFGVRLVLTLILEYNKYNGKAQHSQYTKIIKH